MDIVRNTPLWVWPLLALVVWLGILQTKDRSFSRWRVLVLPFVLVALSISGTLSSFGPRLDAFAAWGLVALMAIAVNMTVFHWPRGVTHDAASDSYRVSGSIVPLALILAIFALRFAAGVTLATNPARAADPAFVMTICSLLGACSGLFMARALRILKTAPGDGQHLIDSEN